MLLAGDRKVGKQKGGRLNLALERKTSVLFSVIGFWSLFFYLGKQILAAMCFRFLVLIELAALKSKEPKGAANIFFCILVKG